VDVLADDELVALLLGTGHRGTTVTELASTVLLEAGGLQGLARSGAGRLASIRGLGEAKAWRLAAAIEVGRRLAARAAAERLTLSTPSVVADTFAARIGHLEHEEMWLVALDGRTNVRGVRMLARGGRHGLIITAREVLSAALAEAASAFLLVHNHPSGSPSPSREDISMTRALAHAAEIVGVPLVDHVIVTASGAYCSLLDEGHLSS
jgi:DNA repair protein RadC